MDVWFDLLLFFVLTTLLQWLVLDVIMSHCRLEDGDENRLLRSQSEPLGEKVGFNLQHWLSVLCGQTLE
jgi:hypothetical protein